MRQAHREIFAFGGPPEMKFVIEDNFVQAMAESNWSV